MADPDAEPDIVYTDKDGRLENVTAGDTLIVEITELLLDCCIELLYAEVLVGIPENVGNVEKELLILDV